MERIVRPTREMYQREIAELKAGIEEAFMAGAMNPYKAHFKLVKEAKRYADNLEKSDGGK